MSLDEVAKRYTAQLADHFPGQLVPAIAPGLRPYSPRPALRIVGTSDPFKGDADMMHAYGVLEQLHNAGVPRLPILAGPAMYEL